MRTQKLSSSDNKISLVQELCSPKLFKSTDENVRKTVAATKILWCKCITAFAFLLFNFFIFFSHQKNHSNICFSFSCFKALQAVEISLGKASKVAKKCLLNSQESILSVRLPALAISLQGINQLTTINDKQLFFLLSVTKYCVHCCCFFFFFPDFFLPQYLPLFPLSYCDNQLRKKKKK